MAVLFVTLKILLGLFGSFSTNGTDGGDQTPAAFRNKGSVSFGGDVQGNAILHTVADLSGAKEVLPGMFQGGSLEEAGARIESGPVLSQFLAF